MVFTKPATVREGFKWLPEKQLDVFFVTLNKADKDYSPTTMYLVNSYRVLLTRARQGMVLFVPKGVETEADPSRNSEYYDGIYEYLRLCGIPSLILE